MDTDDFTKRVQPGKKISKLTPFTQQILSLKNKNYTDQQIKDWLLENSVEISRESVRKFIKSRQKTTPTKAPTSTQTQEQSSSKINSTTQNSNISQSEKIKKQLEAQKEEAMRDQFKHDKTGKKSLEE